jgi:outer membrane protein TolC
VSASLKIWPLLCGIVAVAGCAHFEPHPVSPAQSAAQFDARRLDDSGLKKLLAQNLGHESQSWPLEKWDLNSLTLAAFYFHPDLEVARAQWRVAEAGALTAGARPNPSVSFSPGYDTQIPGNYSPWLIPVTFDIPIETAGKRGKRIAEAEKIAESARWSFVTAAWQVRRNVRDSLMDFQMAGRRAALLQAQFAAQTEIAKQLQQRLDAGAISRPELTTAQIALNKSQLDLSAAQAKRAEAHSRLAEALGVSLAALDGVNLEFDFPAIVPDALTSVEARSVALRGRADILGALADYAAAEADLRLQVAKQYPDLHLGPAYSWNSGNAGDSQWSLGVTLELPILDQNQGPIAEAEARRKLAAAKFIALQAQVIGTIDRAVAGLEAARKQLQTGASVLAASERQQKSVAAQVQAGAVERLDLSSAEIELNFVRLAQLDGEAQLQSAVGALEDTLQSPLTLPDSVVQQAQKNPRDIKPISKHEP